MKKIWKFKLSSRPRHYLPAGAKILSVAGQGEEVCLWAEVDTEAKAQERTIHVVATGQEMPAGNLTFLGTAHVKHGVFVFHVYEELP